MHIPGFSLHEFKGKQATGCFVSLKRLMGLPSVSQESTKAPEGEQKNKKAYQAQGKSKLHGNARREFMRALRGAREDTTDPENLPSLAVAYVEFLKMFPKFEDTVGVDEMRDQEYAHLSSRVYLDYSGFGLFSHLQRVLDMSSSSFRLAYVSANLPTHALYGAAEEGTIEACIRRRIMEYLRINEDDYSMVFTASKSSAVRLLAESYRFDTNGRLLTAYDHQSQSIEWMIQCAKEKGARVTTAVFHWPSLRICSKDLKKQLLEKRTKKDSANKGLFVFPLQSRVSGARYSYQWIPLAQQNHWHVLLDASALGPRDMDALGVSVFSPDFIVSSFYKVFGADPTGFACLLIKKSIIQSLYNSSKARGVGMVKILPCSFVQEDHEQVQDIRGFEYDQRVTDPSTMNSFSGPLSSDDLRDKGADGFSMHIAKSKTISESVEPPRVEAGESSQSIGRDMKPSDLRKTPGTSFDSEQGVSIDDEEDNIGKTSVEDEEDNIGKPSVEDEEDNIGKPSVEDEEDNIGKPSVEDEEDNIGKPSVEDSNDEELNKGTSRITVLYPTQDVQAPQEEASESRTHIDMKGKGRIQEEIVPAESEVEARSRIEHNHVQNEAGPSNRNIYTLRELLARAESDDEVNEQHGNAGERKRNRGDASSSHDYKEHRKAAEISEVESHQETGTICKALDQTRLLGMSKIRNRLRYLISWLVISLIKLRHPTSDGGARQPLVQIYGPTKTFDRGASVAFNLYDWNGLLVQPMLVQRLADRNNISLSLGMIRNIQFADAAPDFQQAISPSRTSVESRDKSSPDILVVTIALSFVNSFEDVYKLWAFVAKFLDADFVKKEAWRYHSLNQEIVVLGSTVY